MCRATTRVLVIAAVVLGLAVPTWAVDLGDPNVFVKDGVLQVLDTGTGNKFTMTNQGLRFLRTGGAFLDNFIQNSNIIFRTSQSGLGSRENRPLTLQADGDALIGRHLGIGTTNPTSPLHIVGDAVIDGQNTVDVLEILGGADLAEDFNITSKSSAPGMVVSIDVASPGELMVSTTAYDRTVAGIISGAGGLNPGMRMGQQGTIASGGYPVALTGRVYCKADATLSAIQPGDLLTTSATPGHAMKALDHQQAQGAIIGKAMTPLAAGEKGLVLVLVSLQ